MDETIEMSDQCGSIATRAELDTSQVGANSPFWVYVALKFNSLSPDGDPNTVGIDFLDKVHFTHQYYDSHSVTISPGNHNLFSSTKLRASQAIIVAVSLLPQWKNILQLGQDETKEDDNESDEEDEDLDEDPEGIQERGFANTRSLPVIYLWQWLNEKPEHTNFCSKQLPPAAQLDSLSGAAVGNIQTPAAAKDETGKRKSLGSKANSKEMIVELLTEMQNKQGEKLVRFGMAKLPEATEMKKNINAMISSQATLTKHVASKNAMALVQFKLDAANEALERAITTPNHEKYRAIIKKLNDKMDRYLMEDSDDNQAPSTFQQQLDSASD
jgi:hypothetical protein